VGALEPGAVQNCTRGVAATNVAARYTGEATRCAGDVCGKDSRYVMARCFFLDCPGRA